MIPYKNYPSWLRIPVEIKFNKVIAQLQIEVEHDFTLYQNF